jgi:hypothetical protein
MGKKHVPSLRDFAMSLVMIFYRYAVPDGTEKDDGSKNDLTITLHWYYYGKKE